MAPSGKSTKLPIVPKVDTTIRAKRLMKELKELQKHGGSEDNRIFSVRLRLKKIYLYHRICLMQADLINDNLFEWHVKLYKIDYESPLALDMIELDVPYILLHLVFPDNFPFAPPFMRVVEPRIEKGEKINFFD